MAIVQTVYSADRLYDIFRDYGRGDNFSRAGIELLFDYLDSTDTNVELDVIGLCCEFEEFDEQYIRDSYSVPVDQTTEDFLSYHTAYLGKTDDSFVYAAF